MQSATLVKIKLVDICRQLLPVAQQVRVQQTNVQLKKQRRHIRNDFAQQQQHQLELPKDNFGAVQTL